jgi:hypothetical protein
MKMNTFAPPGGDAIRYLNTFLTAHAARLRAALPAKTAARPRWSSR